MAWEYSTHTVNQNADGWIAVCTSVNGQMTRSSGHPFDHEPTDAEVMIDIGLKTTQWDAEDLAAQNEGAV